MQPWLTPMQRRISRARPARALFTISGSAMCARVIPTRSARPPATTTVACSSRGTSGAPLDRLLARARPGRHHHGDLILDNALGALRVGCELHAETGGHRERQV